MTPREAAEIIGCSSQQVRHLIRIGTLRATVTQSAVTGYQPRYSLTKREVERYRDKPQERGYPRGRKRN